MYVSIYINVRVYNTRARVCTRAGDWPERSFSAPFFLGRFAHARARGRERETEPQARDREKIKVYGGFG